MTSIVGRVNFVEHWHKTNVSSGKRTIELQSCTNLAFSESECGPAVPNWNPDPNPDPVFNSFTELESDCLIHLVIV